MPLLKSWTNLKLTIANVLLVANAFVWYMLAFNTLKMLLDQANASTPETILVIGVNTAAIAISAVIGSLFSVVLRKKGYLLSIWLLSGVIVSLLPLILNLSSLTSLVLISAVFGAYFGIGMPATMGYYSTATKVENRGRFAGLTFFVIGIIFSITGVLIFDSILLSCLILTLVRVMGFVVFLSYQRTKKDLPAQLEEKPLRYKSVLLNKSFILYFVPWVLFTLINYMTVPIQRSIFSPNFDYNTLMAMEYVVTAVFAIICGFIADKLGRKRLSIIGFILLGIGYAVIGLFPSANLEFSTIFYVTADGLAWGVFYVLFIFTLWGDLAQNRMADKVYLLGALPFVSSYFMQMLFQPYLLTIPKETIFSFASVFLFLAVLPLIYAPETLPEKLMKDRDLKSYIENAKKKAAKIEQKTPPKEEPAEPEENNTDYEKAKKLAEKYY
jgi:MFS family permease